MMTLDQLEALIPELKARGAKGSAKILLASGAGRVGILPYPIGLEGQDVNVTVDAGGHYASTVTQEEAVVFQAASE